MSRLSCRRTADQWSSGASRGSSRNTASPRSGGSRRHCHVATARTQKSGIARGVWPPRSPRDARGLTSTAAPTTAPPSCLGGWGTWHQRARRVHLKPRFGHSIGFVSPTSARHTRAVSRSHYTACAGRWYRGHNPPQKNHQKFPQKNTIEREKTLPSVRSGAGLLRSFW